MSDQGRTSSPDDEWDAEQAAWRKGYEWGRVSSPELPTYGTEYLRLDEDQEVPVRVCDLCGSLVLLTGNHTEWHASLVTR